MKTMLESIIEDRDAWKARAARALEDCDRLRAALEKYGWHLNDECPGMWIPRRPGPCNCGFDAALSAVRRDEKTERHVAKGGCPTQLYSRCVKPGGHPDECQARRDEVDICGEQHGDRTCQLRPGHCGSHVCPSDDLSTVQEWRSKHLGVEWQEAHRMKTNCLGGCANDHEHRQLKSQPPTPTRGEHE